jgi:hypothetical protein
MATGLRARIAYLPSPRPPRLRVNRLPFLSPFIRGVTSSALQEDEGTIDERDEREPTAARALWAPMGCGSGFQVEICQNENGPP